MIKLGNLPYNDAGNTVGGVETPITIRSSSGANTLGQHIDLYADDTGFGVQSNTLYSRTGGNNIAFYIGGNFNSAELNPGGGVLAGYFTPNGLNMNNNKISDVADPVSANDAVNLNYLTQ